MSNTLDIAVAHFGAPGAKVELDALRKEAADNLEGWTKSHEYAQFLKTQSDALEFDNARGRHLLNEAKLELEKIEPRSLALRKLIRATNNFLNREE